MSFFGGKEKGWLILVMVALGMSMELSDCVLRAIFTTAVQASLLVMGSAVLFQLGYLYSKQGLLHFEKPLE